MEDLPSTIKRILVIRLGAMGDLVHAASAVQALKKLYPDVEVDWLTSPLYQPLLQAFTLNGKPLLHKIWGYDKTRGGLACLVIAIQALQSKKYQAVINLQPSLKTTLISWACQLNTGKDFQISNYRKEKLVIRGEAQREITRRHAVEDFLQPFLNVFPELTVEQNLTQQFPPQLSILDVVPAVQLKKPYIALIIGVGQKRGNRGWPLSAYKELIHLVLEKSDYQIALIGGPEEVEAGEALKDQFNTEERVQNTCGNLALLETASVLKNAAIIIGGDTGPLHLASCFEIPTISLFGPTSVDRTGALGAQSLRQHIPPPSHLSCWPCELSECPLPAEENLACMKGITPEQVWEKLSVKLSNH